MILARLLPLLLLAGCAAATPAQQAGSACQLEKAADIPITLQDGFIVARATADNRPILLLIDTGAESSMVTPAAMRKLELQSDPNRTTHIHGTGGTITTHNAVLQSFGIGGMSMLDQSAVVGPLPIPPQSTLDAQGLLGADWLRDFDVDLDVPNRRVVLYRVHNCDGDYIPWRGHKTKLIAQIYGQGLVVFPVKLDGHTVPAMLDSGSNGTDLSEAGAAATGVGAKTLARDSEAKFEGVDGAALITHMHLFDTFEIGDVRYAQPNIAVSPMHLTVADMLLGTDWLRSNRVWISYANHRITIQPVAPRA